LVIEPDNESMLRDCATLSDTGDRGSTRRADESFRAHLGRDPGVEPSATTEDLMAAIRMDQPLVLFPPPLAAGNPQYPLPWRRS